MKSARENNKPIPHILFAGAAGCGKTTLAVKLAEYANVKFISALPQSLKTMASIIETLEKLDPTGYTDMGNWIEGIEIKPSIVFIDEIHNLKPLEVQEWLGIIMEDWEIEIASGNTVWFPKFTLVGATTDSGKLSKPFRDRFKMNFVFKPYTQLESVQIVLSHAKRLGANIDMPAAQVIAQRGRGVPRILVGYLERVIDMAYVQNAKVITESVAKNTFEMLGVDEIGLTETETKILKTLDVASAPVGLDNLSIITNEAPKTILTSIEPYLIQQGLVVRTGKGRAITQKGRDHLSKSGKTKVFHKKELPPGYKRNI